jgi:4-diphosphocytidyl-2-C-methyl-D-erythritol kinase
VTQPLVVRCPAKINTVLVVRRQRPDGYHDLDTELVSLALHDVLELTAAPELSLDVDGASADELPAGSNLVLAAAQRLQRHVGASGLPGARMRLTKRIPIAAGLGGGSSDAAGALVGLSRLHGLAVPHDELAALALELGSDVPYFLVGGRQRGQSRGELLTPLPDRPSAPVLLMRPRQALSTRTVFEAHAARASRRSESALTSRKMGTTFSAETWWSLVSPVVHDDLFEAATSLMPYLAELAELVRGAMPRALVSMTGSGPTMFALFGDACEADAEEAMRWARERLADRCDVLLTRTTTVTEYQASRFEPG